MKIAFIAVNYNNCYISANYIATVKKMNNYDKHDIDIVMVDNFSEENDFFALKQQISSEEGVILVRTEKNLGYFGGLNFGIKQIDYKTYDYVVAGNNDLFFDRFFLDVLEKKKYREDQSVIVPDLLTINGVHQNPQFVDVPSKKRLLGYKINYTCYFFSVCINIIYRVQRKKRIQAKKTRVDDSTEIFLCTGALMLLRPSFFDKCGLLDDSLFLWGEEVALAHQLVENKQTMLYDPDLLVIHMESASVGKIASHEAYLKNKASYKIYRNYYYK